MTGACCAAFYACQESTVYELLIGVLIDRSLQVAEARSMAFFWDKKKFFLLITFHPFSILLGVGSKKKKPDDLVRCNFGKKFFTPKGARTTIIGGITDCKLSPLLADL